jgi:hypothetical protein
MDNTKKGERENYVGQAPEKKCKLLGGTLSGQWYKKVFLIFKFSIYRSNIDVSV